MGATGPKCNFFLQICNKVPGRGLAGAKGHVAPPGEGGGPVAPLRRPGGPSTGATGGPVAPLPPATGCAPLYISR